MVVDELFHYLRKGNIVAGELPCADRDRRAWVGIYPLQRTNYREDLAREGILVHPASEEPIYRIRTFELPRSLENTWFGEDDMLNRQNHIAIGDDDLLGKLAALGVGVQLLDVAWRNDYPL